MLSIKFVRENTQAVIENLKRKNQSDKQQLVDKVLAIDVEHRSVLQEAEKLRSQRNSISKRIADAKKAGEDASAIMQEAKQIPVQIKELEEKQNTLYAQMHNMLLELPNIMHKDVPLGKDDSENVELNRFGEAKDPDFEVRNHAELIEALGVADFDASARVAGKGFYFLFGDLVLLNQALQQFALQHMISKGYTPVEPPLMINKDALMGVTDLAQRNEMIFKIDGQELYLIGTSEHSLIAMFMGQQIDHTKLPLKLCSISPCFRQEIGSHGLDEKGLFRTHQFNKIEQIVICHPDESQKYFEEILQNTIDIFTALELPIRTLNICSGDLGDMKHIQYDVESYSPRRKDYFEVGSCSNLTENQSMLLDIRVRHHDGNFYPHTLNNTALATSRAMVSILENCQDAEGNIVVPEVLRPFMMGKDKIVARDKVL